MAMNNFGCVAADIYPILTAGPYIPSLSELGGAAAVASAITNASDEVVQALPEEVFQQLNRVDLAIVENRATANQTTVTLPHKPVKAGKTFVWAAQPRFFKYRPYKSTDLLTDEEFFDPSTARILSEKIEGTDFTIDSSTGVITFLTGKLLAAHDMVVCSYDVDTEAGAYTMPSLRNMIAKGAAARIASVLYPRESTQWAYIDKLTEDFAESIKQIQSKEWIPPELRKMQFWKALVPSGLPNASIRSGRLYRA